MDGYSLDIVKFETRYINKTTPYRVKVIVQEPVTEIVVDADGNEKEVTKMVDKTVEETRNKIKTEPVDLVHYAQPGCRQRSVAVAKISHISAVGPGDGETEKMARLRWDFIRPHYENWKTGQTMGIEPGKTPLGAWGGISPETAEQFRFMGLHTVESVRDASDAILARCPVPNVRELQKQAKLFLESADKLAVANEITKAREENAELKNQIDELKRMVVDLANAEHGTPAASEKPRRSAKSAEAAA